SVVVAADGRAVPTSLTQPLLQAMSLSEARDLVPALHGGAWDRTRLAALAPLVLDAAIQGDATASTLLRAGARELAVAVAAVVTKLGLPATGFPLALAGGLLLSSALYRQLVVEEVQKCAINPGPVKLVHEPAEGALSLAVQQLSSV